VALGTEFILVQRFYKHVHRGEWKEILQLSQSLREPGRWAGREEMPARSQTGIGEAHCSSPSHQGSCVFLLLEPSL
jgi:hypothetical protein